MATLSLLSVVTIAKADVSNTNDKYETPQVGQKENGFSKPDEKALKVYVNCYEKFKADCGRNIVDDGLNKPGNPSPSDQQVTEWTTNMQLMLHPPPPPEPVETTTYEEEIPTTSSPPTTTTTSSSGGYSIPSYIVECESGGSYTASNPSGAYGAYQIMPGTAAAYSCDLSTPGGQDECAARIYADVGTSAWVCG